MHIQLIDLPPVRVAALRYTGAYGPALGDFWRDSFLPWLASQQLSEGTCYGIGLDDPDTTRPEHCRYDACVEVADDYQASDPAHVLTLPGGRYAIAGFVGKASDIGAAWRQLCGQLIPQQGLSNDARPCFERYLPGMRTDPATGLFRCELCVAVK